jgi:hypothetical protein
MHIAQKLLKFSPPQIDQNCLMVTGTPAHVAARAGNLNMVQLLFQKGMGHNLTNGLRQSVEFVLLQEFSHHSSPRFLNQAPKILQFLVEDRHGKDVAYPLGTDLVTQINNLVYLWGDGLRHAVDLSIVKLREAIMVYLNTASATELLHGSRGFSFLSNFAQLMETAQDRGNVASDLAELCLEILTMFPALELVDPDSIQSLVKPFLFSSSKLSSAHQQLARKLVNVGAGPCQNDLPVIFFDWLKDPKRRECYPLRNYHDAFLLADMQPTIDNAWERAVETKNRGAVEELVAFWPRPSRPSAARTITAAFSINGKPAFLKEVLSLDFDPACPNTDGTFLHLLVRAFVRCDTYTLKQAKEHAKILLSPTANRQGINPFFENAEGETASELLGSIGRSKNNWYQLQDLIIGYENNVPDCAGIQNLSIHGEHQTTQGEEMDLD